MHHTDKNSQYSTITWSVWLNGWVFIYELSGCEFESPCCHLNCRYGACFEQGVPWHLDKLLSVNSLWNSYLILWLIITCNQIHHTDKNSQHSSIIWPVWLNGWVFVHELSGCGFEFLLILLRKTQSAVNIYYIY